MGKRRTTRQQIIELCQSNINESISIVSRLEIILGLYQEGAFECTPQIAASLETAVLFRDVMEKTLITVRQL